MYVGIKALISSPSPYSGVVTLGTVNVYPASPNAVSIGVCCSILVLTVLIFLYMNLSPGLNMSDNLLKSTFWYSRFN